MVQRGNPKRPRLALTGRVGPFVVSGASGAPWRAFACSGASAAGKQRTAAGDTVAEQQPVRVCCGMSKPLRPEFPDHPFQVVAVAPSGSILEHLSLNVNVRAAIAAFDVMVIERPNQHIQLLNRQMVLRDSLEP